MAIWSIVKTGALIPASLVKNCSGYKFEEGCCWFNLSLKSTTNDLINGSVLKIGKRKIYKIKKTING